MYGAFARFYTQRYDEVLAVENAVDGKLLVVSFVFILEFVERSEDSVVRLDCFGRVVLQHIFSFQNNNSRAA